MQAPSGAQAAGSEIRPYLKAALQRSGLSRRSGPTSRYISGPMGPLPHAVPTESSRSGSVSLDGPGKDGGDTVPTGCRCGAVTSGDGVNSPCEHWQLSATGEKNQAAHSAPVIRRNHPSSLSRCRRIGSPRRCWPRPNLQNQPTQFHGRAGKRSDRPIPLQIATKASPRSFRPHSGPPPW